MAKTFCRRNDPLLFMLHGTAKIFVSAANVELDDEFLHDPRYTEMFKETYLRPLDGHRVFAIQPGISISIFTVIVTFYWKGFHRGKVSSCVAR